MKKTFFIVVILISFKSFAQRPTQADRGSARARLLRFTGVDTSRINLWQALITHQHSISDITGLTLALSNRPTSTVVNDSLLAVRTRVETKAASSHSHVESDIINLTADLSAKAALSGASFTGGFGYGNGAGGTVTQATSKSTTVVLNKQAGEITMNGAALASATIVSFTFTNSTISATDVLILNHVTTGTRGAYSLNAQCASGSATIYVRNNTAGSLSEAIVIRYSVIKGATN